MRKTKIKRRKKAKTNPSEKIENFKIEF